LRIIKKLSLYNVFQLSFSIFGQEKKNFDLIWNWNPFFIFQSRFLYGWNLIYFFSFMWTCFLVQCTIFNIELLNWCSLFLFFNLKILFWNLNNLEMCASIYLSIYEMITLMWFAFLTFILIHVVFFPNKVTHLNWVTKKQDFLPPLFQLPIFS
jgi:hypothetical protein